MKVRLLYLAILLFVSQSCKSQQVDTEEVYEPEEYILLDNIFIRDIQNKIINSQANTLLKEKEDFIDRNIEDRTYLKILENLIEEPYAFHNQSFFEKDLKNLLSDKYKNSKIKTMYFLNIQISGESFLMYDFVIIEGVNYEVDLFAFNNQKQEVLHTSIDEPTFLDFVHEFMLNTPYSFEGESLFNNNTQNFTLDRIYSIGQNEYEIQSVVVPRMLNYQINIFEKFFNLNK